MSLVKSNSPEFLTVAQMAARVADGACISIGGHHFARLPIALVRAICKRRPKDLRYLSWAGGLPLEMLLEAEAVASADICFSSLDIFGLAPRFRKAAETGAIEVNDWPALALIQSLRAREQNLPFLPMQVPAGSSMMELCPALAAHTDPRTGRTVALVEARQIDVFCVHAPRADTAGNVEIYGAQALDKIQAGAAKQVFVTVEEVVPAGHLNADGRNLIIQRNRVSAIAHVPGGAYPCSCLPYYATDFARIREILETEGVRLVDALAVPEDGVPPLMRHAAKVPARAIVPAAFQPGAVAPDAPPTVDEVMAVRIARSLDNESHASAGAVSPLANVAYRLAKATHAPGMMITTLSGGHIDVAAGTMSLSMMETMDAQTAVSHVGGEDSYWFAYQGGYITHEIVGTAQIDAQGRTNTIGLTKPSGGMLRLPGQGGMADVANMHQNFIVYVPRHAPAAMVETVEVVSAGRGLISAAEREAAGYRPGAIMVFTNMCVFRYDEAVGQLVVAELMPGATREDVQANTGFKVIFAEDVADVAPPTAKELFALRHEVDPIGLRRLEFVSARERGAILDDIIARDRAATERITGLARPG
ncbi:MULTISPECIES: CoA-transferase [unclassified Roseitalea]|nr:MULTISPECIES: CoA-transferase [unclassified Roseitalea]